MHTTLPIDALDDPGWVHIPFPTSAFLTLRAAGDMRRDGDNRKRFYDSVGIDPERVHVVGQVHSKNVVVVPRGEQRTAAGERFTPDADGLITADPDIVLAVTVADCMPIFLHDGLTGARGVLHSGWKGTGILARAITLMENEFGSQPRDLVVTMGPCISSESYEVDQARAAHFEQTWGSSCVRVADGAHYLDLRAANQEICRRCGVGLVNVIDHCTMQDPHLGSYRRDGADKYWLMLALLGGALQLGEK